MIGQAAILKTLGGLAKPVIQQVSGRLRKRKQLHDAVWRAVDRAANAVPVHRDAFRTKTFVERELVPLVRRTAKRVDHDLLAHIVGERFLLRFAGQAFDPPSLAKRADEAQILGAAFVEALQASLLEMSEWRPLMLSKLALRTDARVQRLTPTLPLHTWEDVVASAQAWIDQALSSAREARSLLGQEVNLDDPALRLKIPRPTLLEAIGQAIQADVRPVLVEGEEGVGKTWAAIEAARAHLAPGTLFLVVPCRSMLRDSLEDLLARTLRDRLGDGDAEGWRRRLRQWFPQQASPLLSAPRIVLLLDGLNQNALVDWRPLLNEAVSQRWSGALKLILTARPRHGQAVADILSARQVEPHVTPVTGFDDVELGLALAAAGYDDLPYRTADRSLQDILRTPRYFRLAARLWNTVSDLETVTPNRLILEDLRRQHAEQHGELSRDDWSSLLTQLGQRVLASGKARFDLGEIRTALSQSSLEASRVEAGLHDIASGRLFQDAGGGTLALTETLAPLAAGMTVVMTLADAPVASTANTLDRLDAMMPDLGADVRAEVLRAATAIALCWPKIGLGEAASTSLLIAWLTSHNPTPGDEFEAQAYVRAWPVVYLDAYEAIVTTVEPDRRALHILETALDQAADLPALQDAVRARALRWAGYVGLRERFLSAERKSERESRDRRLVTMLGVVPDAGPLRLLECDLEIVAAWDPLFLVSFAAQVLARNPLADQIDFFRTAAVAQSVGYAHDGWTRIKWTTRLNRIDPPAADDAFRAAAAAMAQQAKAGQPFFEIGQTAARKLYDLVSQESDEAAMAALTAATPIQWVDLLAQYAADPARSSIALSPLDVELVSARDDITPYVRMRRVQNHYWDPSLTFAPTFRAAVLSDAAERWNPDNLSASSFNSDTDIYFELLDLAMARVAPDMLGHYARSFAVHVAARVTKPLEPGLWRVNAQLVALGETEIAALETRLVHLAQEDDEDGVLRRVRQDLIELIIPQRSAPEQFALIADQAQGRLQIGRDNSLQPPPHDAALAALNAAAADPARLRDVLAGLALSGYAPSPEAAAIVLPWALGVDTALQAMALQVLAAAPTEDIAQRLIDADWRWRPQQNTSNHFGSVILVRCGKAMAFDQLIDRIAPWLLAWAVAERGGAADEAAACAEVLKTALAAPFRSDHDADIAIEAVDEPSIDHPQATRARFAPPDSEEERFHLAFEPDRRQRRLQEGMKRAVARIASAEGAGAVFFHRDVPPQGLEALAAPFAAWTEDLLVDVQRLGDVRHVAPYLLLRMSQVLLRTRPDLGARLWDAVIRKDSGALAFKDWAGGQAYLKVLFGAPASPERDNLIQAVWDETDQASDLGLLAIVNAAEEAGAEAVLDTLIAADLASTRAYRQARAWQARGFGRQAPLDEALRTGRGVPYSWVGRVRLAAADHAARNAAARHWYERFITHPDRDEALAAWGLLLTIIDRRFWSWRLKVEAAAGGPLALRHAHLIANKQALQRAIEKTEKAWSGKFLEEAL